MKRNDSHTIQRLTCQRDYWRDQTRIQCREWKLKAERAEREAMEVKAALEVIRNIMMGTER